MLHPFVWKGTAKISDGVDGLWGKASQLNEELEVGEIADLHTCPEWHRHFALLHRFSQLSEQDCSLRGGDVEVLVYDADGCGRPASFGTGSARRVSSSTVVHSENCCPGFVKDSFRRLNAEHLVGRGDSASGIQVWYLARGRIVFAPFFGRHYPSTSGKEKYTVHMEEQDIVSLSSSLSSIIHKLEFSLHHVRRNILPLPASVQNPFPLLDPFLLQHPRTGRGSVQRWSWRRGRTGTLALDFMDASSSGTTNVLGQVGQLVDIALHPVSQLWLHEQIREGMHTGLRYAKM